MEQQARVQEATGKPKLFISTKLVDIDDDPKSQTLGQPFNFLVKEIENLRWEEVKTDSGIEQKPIWGKQAKHAIDALSYILATINKPQTNTIPRTVQGGVKLHYPSLGI